MPGVICALLVVVFPELILAAMSIHHLEAIKGSRRFVPFRPLGKTEDHTEGVVRRGIVAGHFLHSQRIAQLAGEITRLQDGRATIVLAVGDMVRASLKCVDIGWI